MIGLKAQLKPGFSIPGGIPRYLAFYTHFSFHLCPVDLFVITQELHVNKSQLCNLKIAHSWHFPRAIACLGMV